MGQDVIASSGRLNKFQKLPPIEYEANADQSAPTHIPIGDLILLVMKNYTIIKIYFSTVY